MDPSVVDAVTTVVLVAGGTAVTGMVATVGTVWYGVRRVRRSTRVRRSIDRGSTTVRALTGERSQRVLAGQRLRIERSVQATDEALRAAHAAGRPLGQLPVLADELRAGGGELSRQLRVAEMEPDVRLRARLAAQLEEPVERFLRTAGDLRAATISHVASVDRLGTVGERLDIEVAALEAFDEVYRTGSRVAHLDELPPTRSGWDR